MCYDVIVCGAGVEGLWTSLRLAEQKKNVLLIEQGSSHGGSRIIRYLHETEHHAKMIEDAYKGWKALEENFGEQLFVRTGLVKISNSRTLEAVCKVLTSVSAPHELLDAHDIQQKFPGLKSETFGGVFDSRAGILKADRCLLALKEVFLSLGGHLHEGQEVNRIIPVHSNLVNVQTNKEIYSCHSVILTCGPWINKVLKPLNSKLPIKTYRVEVAYWKAKDPQVYNASNGFPAVSIDSELGGHMYSTPSLEYSGLVKVCYHRHIESDPDSDENPIKKFPEAAERHAMMHSRLIGQHFTQLIPKPAKQELCMLTIEHETFESAAVLADNLRTGVQDAQAEHNRDSITRDSADGDYILDRHPQYTNVVIGAGMSGHGFKLAPVVGQILCDLALNKEARYPLHHFVISRFNNPKL